MATLSTRLDDWLREAIVHYWEAHGEGPSAGMRRVAQEWWAMQAFPSITFRDGVSGRRAVLRAGPDVWEVALVAREYPGDHAGLHEHFGGTVTHEALAQALAYAERFPEEIEGMIAGNRRIEALLQSSARG